MKKIVIRNVNYLLIGELESLLTYINNGIIDSLNIKTIGKTNRNISLSLQSFLYQKEGIKMNKYKLYLSTLRIK